MLHAYLIAGGFACALVGVSLFNHSGNHFRTKCAYLLRKRKAAFEAFERLTTGYEGLCVCQALPPGKNYANTLFLDGNGLSSHDLEKLICFINNFIKPGKRVVLFDGLDYLIKENTFEEGVKFLHLLKDQVVLHEAILLTTLDLDSFSKREQSFIRQTMDELI